MLMHNPPHPGEVLRELCLEPLGLSVTAAAEALREKSEKSGQRGIFPNIHMSI